MQNIVIWIWEHPLISLLSYILVLIVIASVFSFLMLSESFACEFKFCRDSIGASRISNVTNARRQRVGDIYAPGHNRRVQIRNNRRQIIGYIKTNGTVTNTRRQKIGEVK